MNIKFTGSFAELKDKLNPIGGDWDETQPNKKVLRVHGGVLNWFESTGNFFAQGRSPGKEEIENTIPHLLYPDEYPKSETIPLVTNQDVSPPSESEPADSSIEHLYLTGSFTNTELVIGIVNAVGTEYKRVLDPLKNRLEGFGYKVEEIRVSTLLPQPDNPVGEYDRIKHFMNKGDELRKDTQNNAILAAGASSKIQDIRNHEMPKTAFIVNSLNILMKWSFYAKFMVVDFTSLVSTPMKSVATNIW